MFWSAINDLIGKIFKPKWILEWLDVVRLVPFSGTENWFIMHRLKDKPGDIEVSPGHLLF